MMNHISKYIGTTITISTLLCMCLLLGIETIFILVNELRYLGTGDYTLWRIFLFYLCSVPQNIYQMFPLSALVGTLMGLGVLASRSELIIMQVAGLSIGNIIKSVMKTAVLLALLAWALGEGLAPYVDNIGQNIKIESLSGGQALRTQHGTWLRDGKDFVHIRSMDLLGHLEGLTRYGFNQQHLLKASFAEYGDYADAKWTLHNIQETQFLKENTASHRIPSETWESVIDPNIVRVVGQKYLEKLSLVGLWQTIKYRQKNNLDAGPFKLAFWEKCVQPFATLVMMFLAIPFIFGPLRSSTMGLRLMVGILVGFLFHTLNQLFGPLTLVYQLPPLLGAILPTCLFLGLGVWLIRRQTT